MLAIVIPYYKKKYFEETLQSIANQTNKDFVLYIGDDASPESPNAIIEEYKDEIDIVYHRFEENLGSKDLVAQWNRCLKLTNNENWIWLFSDDDTMSNTCVAEFYRKISHNNYDFLLFRYSKKSLNIKNGDTLISTYSNGVTPFETFVMDCLDWTENGVTMPEFIFHRCLYEKKGIVKFPMAWGSDKATWIEYAYESGQVYNLNSVVYVKYSNVNISGNRNLEVVLKKTDIELKFSQYVDELLKKMPIKYPQIDIKYIKRKYVDKMLYKMKIFPIRKRFTYIKYILPFVDEMSSVKNIILNLFSKKIKAS